PLEWSLPDLAQMRVGIGVAIARSAEGVGECRAATRAVARARLRPGIARPHQAILFVVAEVLRLAAPGRALSIDSRMRRTDTGEVADRIVDAVAAEDGAGAATATLLPGGTTADGAQVPIVGIVVVGERDDVGTGGDQEVEVADEPMHV